jgi:hypothetical protein
VTASVDPRPRGAAPGSGARAGAGSVAGGARPRALRLRSRAAWTAGAAATSRADQGGPAEPAAGGVA